MAADCLVGFDLDKDESIVWPAYNDRQGVSAAFNLNVLERINRELGADFDVAAFSHRADYVRSKERMEMYLVSREPQVVRIAGMEFSFEQGETIHTEYSYKYSLEHFGRLTSRAGFRHGRTMVGSERILRGAVSGRQLSSCGQPHSQTAYPPAAPVRRAAAWPGRRSVRSFAGWFLGRSSRYARRRR